KKRPGSISGCPVFAARFSWNQRLLSHIALRGADRGTRPPALLAEQGEGLLAKAHRNVKHRPETNRTLAAAQSEQSEFEQTGVELVALFAAGQIKREHQSSAPRRLDQRFRGAQGAQALQQGGADHTPVLHHPSLFGATEQTRRA